ncbi:phosphonopyruvate decarboxylase [Deferribacterales bacterium RsTz2092]|nr:phosphonopyruvate decarboxylase [Deferribacterales bacterium]
MISTEIFGGALASRFSLFAGVPDSLLKPLCSYFSTLGIDKHVVCANEGNAVALVAGHYMATSTPACVYMQNSGMGNALNPLISLNDPLVYGIPTLLIIGWRGEPNVHDEPQHIKQGLITLPLLETMGIKYSILPDNDEDALKALETACQYMGQHLAPYALVVRKDTFGKYSAPARADGSVIVREQAIEFIIQNVADALFVSTTGMISRELFELREKHGQTHERDFLTVGSMGHSSQIALGIALAKPDKRVICLDGDGAVLMHLGGLALIATQAPKNFVHIVLNNAAHDSVGGQATVATGANLATIAKSIGYKKAVRITDVSELNSIGELIRSETPLFIEILVKRGARAELGRPSQSPVQCKDAFMKAIQC